MTIADVLAVLEAFSGGLVTLFGVAIATRGLTWAVGLFGRARRL